MRAWAMRRAAPRAMPRVVPRRCNTLLAGVALVGAVALVGGPAYGQAAGVGNAGDASAATGGNASTGNASTNAAAADSTATTPPGSSSEPLLGGLLGLVLNVGGSNTANTSSGTSTVSSGPANSSGNNSDTSVDQASAGGGGRPVPVGPAVIGPGVVGPGVIGTVFSPFIGPSQSAGVSNEGTAAGSTGGNTSTGNGSTNVAGTTQTVTGGLIAAGINVLGGNASNVSNGSSAIGTGPANAAGNTSTSAINQERLGAGFGVGGGALCDGLFRFDGQRVDVTNAGTAQASTGDNTSVGNQSTNVATADSNVAGGLIGLNVNLLGQNASNSSDGQSAIDTGAANAAGNRSTTGVTQQCLQPVAFPGPPVITPAVVRGVPVPGAVVPQAQLARTGTDPFVLGLVAFSLLFGGLLFMVWERVEALPAGSRRSSWRSRLR